MKNKYILILTFLSIFKLSLSFGQDIEVITRNQGDKVAIRWVPISTNTWKQGVINGYFVKRTLTKVNGLPVTGTQTPVILNAGLAVKPKTLLSEWATAFSSADSSIAKSLKADIDSVILRYNSSIYTSEIWDELYDLNLSAADIFYQGALLSGLGFVDNTAPVTNTYKYEVYLANNAAIKGFEEQGSQITLAPHKIKNIENFKTKVSLYFNPDTLSSANYVQYFIERALDNGSFIKQHTVPLVSGIFNFQGALPPPNDVTNTNTPLPPINFINFIDTNVVYGKIHKYRIKAISLFGETTYSPEIQTLVKTIVPYKPLIVNTTFQASGLCVKWKFPSDTLLPSALNAISGFLVQKSIKINGPYSTLLPSGTTIPLIAKNDTVKCFPSIVSNYYVRVVGLTLEGDSLISLSNLVIPEDSIPPLKPINVTAVLNDVTGIATITWAPDPLDTDILGYKVFKANLIDEEPTEISKYYLKTLTLADTLINTDPSVTGFYKLSNPKAYYYVMAIDQSRNQSNLSLPATLTKPDKTPPTQPIIYDFNISNSVVKLFWNNSASPDIKLHKVIRTKIADINASPPYTWQVLQSYFNSGDTTYIDNSITQTGLYFYGIVAIDSTNLESNSNLILVNMESNSFSKPVFSNFTGVFAPSEPKLTLTWVYSAPEIESYQIFKSEGSNSMVLWQTLKPNSTTFTDFSVEFNKSYTYNIRAVYIDGSKSNLQPLTIQTPVKDLLQINSTYFIFAYTSSIDTIRIYSNKTWSFSNIPSWLTLSQTTGTGNANVSLTTSLNAGLLSRNQIINLHIPGDTLIYEVNQATEELGEGLLASYFGLGQDNVTYSTQAQVVRIEDNVNLIPSYSGPAIGMSVDFAATWEGFIQVPTSGLYTFYSAADNGMKFYLDNVLRMQVDSSTINIEKSSVAIQLEAGRKIPIKLEYWDRSGLSGVYLKWQSNLISKQIIPKKYLFPKENPTLLSADPLHQKCFFIQEQDNGYKYIEAMSNFILRPRLFTGRNDQLWKFEKNEDATYKMITMMDEQARVIQAIETPYVNGTMISQGFFSNLETQKWNIINTDDNKYKIQLKNSVFGPISLASFNDFRYVIQNTPNYSFRLFQTACPSTNKTIETNPSEIVFIPAGQNVDLNITTQLGWIIEQSSTWFSMDVTAGYGSKKVVLSAPANNSEQIRFGTIVIKSDNQTKTIRIIQNPVPYDCTNNQSKIFTKIILNGTVVKDRACLEITLDEGFETEEFSEYEAEIVKP